MNPQNNEIPPEIVEDQVSTASMGPAPAPVKSKSRKKLLLGLTLLLVVAAGTLLYILQSSNKDEPLTQPTQNSQSTTAGGVGSVFCTRVGLSSLQCENLDTKELRKYMLPDWADKISGMTANPSGTAFLISAWEEKTNGDAKETLSIYDQELRLVANIPTEINEGLSNISTFDVKWKDDKTLAYRKFTGANTATSTIYEFNTETKTEKLLVELDATIERYMPVAGEKYIYGVEAFTVEAENATKRKLVVIDLESGDIRDIEVESDAHDQIDAAYSPVSKRFYRNVLNSAEQTYDIYVYEVLDPTGKPKLNEVQHIKNSYAAGATAYEAIVTKKGIYTNKMMLEKRFPLTFYDEKGTATESSVGVAPWGSEILLSLSDFPKLTRAEKDEVELNDLFRPAPDTPEKIVSFLEDKALNNSDCTKGEYSTFEIYNYDNDKQFSVIESSCSNGGSNGLSFYALEGDTYKFVTSTQEGMSCEQRDSLGISAKVFPECRLPGEEL